MLRYLYIAMLSLVAGLNFQLVPKRLEITHCRFSLMFDTGAASSGKTYFKVMRPMFCS